MILIDNILRAILAVLAAALLAQPAFAQGFMVKPMRLEASPRAGSTVDLSVQVWNTAGDAARDVELRLVDLSQTPGGSWRVVEPDSGEVLDGHASGLAWSTLEASRMSVPPLEPIQFSISVSPPPSAIGSYFVGVVVEEPKKEGATGIVVRTRFLIPLIIQIQGRAVRQKIALQDVQLTHDAAAGAPPATNGWMNVANIGQTYSRVRGELKVERLEGERWRLITQIDYPERSIIPGVTLDLAHDLGRRLPSGSYRLHGELYVDGRRTTPLEKVIDFVGDPDASLAYDASLLLEPKLLDLKIVPGATRTASLQIENTSADPVTIEMSALTPKSLVGVAMGELLGTDLSAEPWTEIRPDRFTLRPGGRQNVRVISRVPREGVNFPNYYADLVLKGTFADGQSAGETRSTVHLANDAALTYSDGVIEQLTLAEDEESKFVLQLRYANTGNVHVDPVARVALLNTQGTLIKAVDLEGDSGALLPLGKRSFSGVLDFGGIEPGFYAVRSTVRTGATTEKARQFVAQVALRAGVDAQGNPIDVPTVSLLDASISVVPEDTDPALDGVPAATANQISLEGK